MIDNHHVPSETVIAGNSTTSGIMRGSLVQCNWGKKKCPAPIAAGPMAAWGPFVDSAIQRQAVSECVGFVELDFDCHGDGTRSRLPFTD
jgi:hypothetical protein